MRRWITPGAALAVAVCLAALGAPAARGAEEQGVDSLYKHLAVFAEVLGLADRAYVDELGESLLLDGAVDGLVDVLDPFSLLVRAEDLELWKRTRRVGSERSGLLLVKERGIAYVLAVDPGSPAAGAGLEPGDLVASIDGEQTRSMSLLRIRSILAGESGAVVGLELLRGSSRETSELKLARYARPRPSLTQHDGVAVLVVGAFVEGTASEVRTILGRLTPTPAGDPGEAGGEGRLVVDLRGAAGGEVTAAYDVAGLFARGDLGALVSRGEVLERFRSDGEPAWRGRVAVLVDRATQGPAEVLATVLRQTIGAQLVGGPSYGHCGRQGELALSGGDRLVMTVAFYAGPDRVVLTQPLEPDIAVRSAPFAGAEEDEALEAALELLRVEDEGLAEVALLRTAPSRRRGAR
jgi:carboxyl-terminal processing protease